MSAGPGGAPAWPRPPISLAWSASDRSMRRRSEKQQVCRNKEERTHLGAHAFSTPSRGVGGGGGQGSVRG